MSADLSPALPDPDDSKRLDAPDPAPFFPEMEIEVVELMERQGHFTGERLKLRFPQKYELILKLMAEGILSEKEISETCQVSRNTVAALRRNDANSIEQLKRTILGTVREALRMTTERVLELAPEMSAKDAIIATGVLAEKMQLLSGEATAIVANVGDKLRHADINAILDALPVADAHEVPPMGSPGGSPQQKGLPDAVEIEAFPGARDCESVPLQREDGRSNVQDNNIPETDRSNQEGGRGVAEGEGGQTPNSL